MGLVETEGVILKTYSLAEADKIVVLLTQYEGLVRGVAKGAKRLKSRFGGGLEPFSIINISYFQKEERELVSIGQVELIKSYFEAAGDPRFLQKFSYLAELLLEFAPPHDPNERLYRMARVCLETAAGNPQSLESIGLYFELWILKIGGYLPDWRRCDNCKREVVEHEPVSIKFNFQIICQQCQKSKSNQIITPEQRALFFKAQRISPIKFAELGNLQIVEVREVSSVLRRLISNIIGKETIEEKILTATL